MATCGQYLEGGALRRRPSPPRTKKFFRVTGLIADSSSQKSISKNLWEHLRDADLFTDNYFENKSYGRLTKNVQLM